MTAALPLPDAEPVEELIGDWVLWQRARGLSVRNTTERAAIIARLPNAVHITPAGIDRFLLRGDWTKSTRATYHQSIRAWCRWLITTGRRTDDPTILAPPPKVPRARSVLEIGGLECIRATSPAPTIPATIRYRPEHRCRGLRAGPALPPTDSTARRRRLQCSRSIDWPPPPSVNKQASPVFQPDHAWLRQGHRADTGAQNACDARTGQRC